MANGRGGTFPLVLGRNPTPAAIHEPADFFVQPSGHSFKAFVARDGEAGLSAAGADRGEEIARHGGDFDSLGSDDGAGAAHVVGRADEQDMFPAAFPGQGSDLERFVVGVAIGTERDHGLGRNTPGGEQIAHNVALAADLILEFHFIAAEQNDRCFADPKDFAGHGDPIAGRGEMDQGSLIPRRRGPAAEQDDRVSLGQVRDLHPGVGVFEGSDEIARQTGAADEGNEEDERRRYPGAEALPPPPQSDRESEQTDPDQPDGFEQVENLVEKIVAHETEKPGG